MAQNYQQRGEIINAAATDPATPACGDAVIVGTIAGVAVTKEAEGGNAPGECSIATKGIWKIPVTGHNGTTGTAVNAGDRVYYDTAIHGLNLNSATGVLYGKALAAVNSGATTTVPVRLIQA